MLRLVSAYVIPADFPKGDMAVNILRQKREDFEYGSSVVLDQHAGSIYAKLVQILLKYISIYIAAWILCSVMCQEDLVPDV